jgi:hypothetical protein
MLPTNSLPRRSHDLDRNVGGDAPRRNWAIGDAHVADPAGGHLAEEFRNEQPDPTGRVEGDSVPADVVDDSYDDEDSYSHNPLLDRHPF